MATVSYDANAFFFAVSKQSNQTGDVIMNEAHWAVKKSLVDDVDSADSTASLNMNENTRM